VVGFEEELSRPEEREFSLYAAHALEELAGDVIGVQWEKAFSNALPKLCCIDLFKHGFRSLPVIGGDSL